MVNYMVYIYLLLMIKIMIQELRLVFNESWKHLDGNISKRGWCIHFHVIYCRGIYLADIKHNIKFKLFMRLSSKKCYYRQSTYIYTSIVFKTNGLLRWIFAKKKLRIHPLYYSYWKPGAFLSNFFIKYYFFFNNFYNVKIIFFIQSRFLIVRVFSDYKLLGLLDFVRSAVGRISGRNRFFWPTGIRTHV